MSLASHRSSALDARERVPQHRPPPLCPSPFTRPASWHRTPTRIRQPIGWKSTAGRSTSWRGNNRSRADNPAPLSPLACASERLRLAGTLTVREPVVTIAGSEPEMSWSRYALKRLRPSCPCCWECPSSCSGDERPPRGAGGDLRGGESGSRGHCLRAPEPRAGRALAGPLRPLADRRRPRQPRAVLPGRPAGARPHHGPHPGHPPAHGGRSAWPSWWRCRPGSWPPPGPFLARPSSTPAAFLGLSFPTFWLGIMLILLFAEGLGWLPGSGIASYGQEADFLSRLRTPCCRRSPWPRSRWPPSCATSARGHAGGADRGLREDRPGQGPGPRPGVLSTPSGTPSCR